MHVCIPDFYSSCFCVCQLEQVVPHCAAIHLIACNTVSIGWFLLGHYIIVGTVDPQFSLLTLVLGN